MICVSASRAKGKGKEYICIHIFRPPDRPPTDHRAQRGEEKLLSQKLGSHAPGDAFGRKFRAISRRGAFAHRSRFPYYGAACRNLSILPTCTLREKKTTVNEITLV